MSGTDSFGPQTSGPHETPAPSSAPATVSPSHLCPQHRTTRRRGRNINPSIGAPMGSFLFKAKSRSYPTDLSLRLLGNQASSLSKAAPSFVQVPRGRNTAKRKNAPSKNHNNSNNKATWFQGFLTSSLSTMRFLPLSPRS